MSNDKRHAWDHLTDDEIEAIAASSSEFPRVTDDDLRNAVAVSGSGRAKVPISIRVDEEALEFFKAHGAGYQTRINDVLVRFARGELKPAGSFGVRRAAHARRARAAALQAATVTAHAGGSGAPHQPTAL